MCPAGESHFPPGRWNCTLRVVSEASCHPHLATLEVWALDCHLFLCKMGMDNPHPLIGALVVSECDDIKPVPATVLSM